METLWPKTLDFPGALIVRDVTDPNNSFCLVKHPAGPDITDVLNFMMHENEMDK